jgi:hypothetical protein
MADMGSQTAGLPNIALLGQGLQQPEAGKGARTDETVSARPFVHSLCPCPECGWHGVGAD